MKIIKKIINKNNCQIKDEINYEISLIHWMRNIINEHLNIFTIIKKENFLTLKKRRYKINILWYESKKI